MNTNTNDEELSGLRLKNLDVNDRPREKAMNKGFSALTNAELLAILIGSGTPGESVVDLSQKILINSGHSLGDLGKKSIGYLKKTFKGVGDAKAITILAAMELGRRYLQEKEAQKGKEKIQVVTSDIAYNLMRYEMEHLQHEEFWMVALSTSKHVIGKYRISSGSLVATVVDPKMVMKMALDNMAHSIIIYHNHPSGVCTPSNSDNILTEKIKKCGEILELNLIDHIIIGDGVYYSYASMGNL